MSPKENPLEPASSGAAPDGWQVAVSRQVTLPLDPPPLVQLSRLGGNDISEVIY